jgi:hypothetical protein
MDICYKAASVSVCVYIMYIQTTERFVRVLHNRLDLLSDLPHVTKRKSKEKDKKNERKQKH